MPTSALITILAVIMVSALALIAYLTYLRRNEAQLDAAAADNTDQPAQPIDDPVPQPPLPASGLTVETGLYAAVFVLALVVRLWGLGAAPMQPGETPTAMAAYRFVQGDLGSPIVPESGLLFGLQAATFWLFGSSNALARLWPALAGALFVAGPFFLRAQLGRRTALLTALLMAVSPTLVATSREASGTMLALLCLLVVVAGLVWFVGHGRVQGAWAAAVGLGVGFSAGPDFVTGIVLLALCWGVWAAFGGPGVRQPQRQVLREKVVGLLVAFAVAAVASGSLMLVYAPGLTAAGATVPVWLGGWSAISYRHPGMGLGLTLLYEPLVVLFGVVGIAATAPQWRRWLPLWVTVGAALLFTVFYAGRSATDTVFVLLPLMVLAARALVWAFGIGLQRDEWLLVAVQATVLVAVLAFSWLGFAAHARGMPATVLPLRFVDTALTLAPINLAMAGLGITVVLAGLFAAGWPPLTAARAFAMALVVMLGLFHVRNLWGLTHTWAAQPGELWYDRTVAVPESLMIGETLHGISNREVGRPNEVVVVLVDDATGPIAWQLRDFTELRLAETLGAYVLDPVILTPGDIADPNLGSAYVGQTLPALATRTARPALGDIPRYIFQRDLPSTTEHRAIWVREDIFAQE